MVAEPFGAPLTNLIASTIVVVVLLCSAQDLASVHAHPTSFAHSPLSLLLASRAPAEQRRSYLTAVECTEGHKFNEASTLFLNALRTHRALGANESHLRALLSLQQHSEEQPPPLVGFYDLGLHISLVTAENLLRMEKDSHALSVLYAVLADYLPTDLLFNSLQRSGARKRIYELLGDTAVADAIMFRTSQAQQAAAGTNMNISARLHPLRHYRTNSTAALLEAVIESYLFTLLRQHHYADCSHCAQAVVETKSVHMPWHRSSLSRRGRAAFLALGATCMALRGPRSFDVETVHSAATRSTRLIPSVHENAIGHAALALLSMRKGNFSGTLNRASAFFLSLPQPTPLKTRPRDLTLHGVFTSASIDAILLSYNANRSNNATRVRMASDALELLQRRFPTTRVLVDATLAYLCARVGNYTGVIHHSGRVVHAILHRPPPRALEADRNRVQLITAVPAQVPIYSVVNGRRVLLAGSSPSLVPAHIGPSSDLEALEFATSSLASSQQQQQHLLLLPVPSNVVTWPVRRRFVYLYVVSLFMEGRVKDALHYTFLFPHWMSNPATYAFGMYAAFVSGVLSTLVYVSNGNRAVMLLEIGALYLVRHYVMFALLNVYAVMYVITMEDAFPIPTVGVTV
eukprot:PhM_4_TR14283/c0_g1_i1/m.86268